jgi:hypothetical protein
LPLCCPSGLPGGGRRRRVSRFHPRVQGGADEADAVSAELTSSHDAAAALVNVHVTAPFVDENYWQRYFRKADEIAEPEYLPWQGLNDFLDVAELSDIEKRLQQAMAIETNFSDTHPSLKDRLAALDVDASITKPGKVSAAASWFGENYANVIRDFDKEWHEQNAERWRGRYEYVQESAKTLEEFSAKPAETLSDSELLQLANLRYEFRSPDEAISTFRQYQLRNPDSPDCAYSLGILLRDKGDPACLNEFRKCLTNPSNAYNAACMAYYFVKEKGDEHDLDFWRETAEAAGREQASAQQERDRLEKGDPLMDADLEDEALQTIISQLKASERVGKIWVARKQTRYYQDIPSYAIVVTIKGFSMSGETAAKKILESMDPFEGWLVPNVGDYKPLAKYIIKHAKRV